MTEEEIREWVERLLEKPKALQELPLILTPEHLFNTPREIRRGLDKIKSALDIWISHAKEDDEMLRIERRWIPFVEIYIPDTSEGNRFFTMAKAIGEIPMVAGVIPRNQNQGYWLKTLYYSYQARGVLFAYKLLGVIPNPLDSQGLFNEYLPETSIRNLDLLTNVDLAEYELIKAGERYIKQRVTKHNIDYPFKNALELFLEIQKQAFLNAWEFGPASQELEWLSIEKQQDFHLARICLLENKPWIKGNETRGTYKEQEQQYISFLMNCDWYGHFILAVRSQHWNLEEYLQQYTKALKAAKKAYIDDFYWQGGQPYQGKKQGEPSHQARKTRNRQRVEATVNILGYILWQWT
jgi:hypothetical protein